LTARRDFGGGLLDTRPGHERAGRLLHTPFGLVARVQRGLVIGWAIGLVLLGLLYGAVIPTIPDLIASNPEMADIVGGSADAEDALVGIGLARRVAVQREEAAVEPPGRESDRPAGSEGGLLDRVLERCARVPAAERFLDLVRQVAA